MQKTTSITLAGTLFHLEESAYKKLDNYLREIKDYFRGLDERDEIISDIETRIAELLMEKREQASDVKRVVSESHIDEVIESMGTVEDFEAFEGGAVEGPDVQSTEKEKSTQTKKLYRDTDDVLLGGVASGLAHYFEVDPFIVRVIFVLSVFLLQWLPVGLYVLFWFIIPQAKTTEEKAAMRGGGVPTLASIKERASHTAESVKKQHDSGTWQRGVRKFFARLKEVVAVIFRAGFVILGAGIALSAFAIAAFGTFFLIVLALGNFPSYLDFPLAEAAYGTSAYFVVLVCGYLVGLIPLLITMALGAALIQGRSLVGKTEFLGMAAVWVLAVVVGLGIFTLTAPGYLERIEAAQSEMSEREFQVADFSAIEVMGANYTLEVVPGGETAVTARASAGAFENFGIRVEGEVLTINEMKPYIEAVCISCDYYPKSVHVTVFTPEIERVDVYGGAMAEVGEFPGEIEGNYEEWLAEDQGSPSVIELQ